MCACAHEGVSAAAGVRPWIGGPTYHWSECRCASECVTVSEDQAGLAREWTKWPWSERGSGSPRASSGCDSTSVSLSMRADEYQLWDQRSPGQPCECVCT